MRIPTVNRRERLLLGALAALALVFLAVKLVAVHRDRAARIVILRAAVAAAEAGPGTDGSAVRAPSPWISDAPPSLAAVQLQRIVEAAGARHAILATSIQSSVEPEGVVAVDASVQGSFEGLVGLLAEIESAERPLLVMNLNIARPVGAPLETAVVSAGFTVKGYASDD